jgi:hypothetical protein
VTTAELRPAAKKKTVFRMTPVERDGATDSNRCAMTGQNFEQDREGGDTRTTANRAAVVDSPAAKQREKKKKTALAARFYRGRMRW